MMCQSTCRSAGHPHVNQSCVWPGPIVPVHCTPVHIVRLRSVYDRMLKRPANRTRSADRLVTVIQYVVCDGLARSTATSHVSCAPPGHGVSGMTFHKTCRLDGQPHVNQSCVWLP